MEMGIFTKIFVYGISIFMAVYGLIYGLNHNPHDVAAALFFLLALSVMLNIHLMRDK